MKRGFKCFFGFHGYEVYREIDVLGPNGNPVQKIIVLRCSDCGKMTTMTVDIENERYLKTL